MVGLRPVRHDSAFVRLGGCTVTPVTEPPASVLSAFGLRGWAERLPGGQGTSWRVADVVLKPQVDPTFQEWLGTELATIEQSGFRLPELRRSDSGAWVVEGWAAQTAVPGSPGTGSEADWLAIIGASRALHAAMAALPRPAFLNSRGDPWALADRMAWGETPEVVAPELREVVEGLRPALSPLGPAQLVHGDLTSNVLLHPGSQPVIIDFSPYWRPPAYAEGVVVADAMCWHDARPGLMEEVDVAPGAVARALLFRVLTTSLLHHGRGDRELLEEARRYRSAVTALRS